MRFGVLTLSDRASRGERQDLSGAALSQAITDQGWQVVRTAVLPDDLGSIQKILIEWCDSRQIDVILTTGGTGFSPRDVTPEATQAIVQRPTPGLQEAMRYSGLKTTPHSMLSRGFSGIRDRTLIVNLPGSPKGALANFQVIVPVLLHAVQLIQEDPGSEQGHKVNPGGPGPG